MKVLRYMLFAAFIANGILQPQESYPFVADSLTRALWHLDEFTGSVVSDSSGYHNEGSAVGTTIIQGLFGNARSFNGLSDYVYFASDTSMNFGNESFTIDVWFKTLAEEGVILRRGIAPVPGYMISMHYGCVVGQIGADVDPGTADPLLWAQTPKKYNDNIWHHARFVRDRVVLKVYLYVDDSLAAPPVDDIFNLPIVNDRPLTIGCWENFANPGFFAGSVDEVRLSSPDILRRALRIQVQQASLDFGRVRAGSTKTIPLTISNVGFRDTLFVDSIFSETPLIVPSASQLEIGPGGSRTLDIAYTPTGARTDTGALQIVSNDAFAPTTMVLFTGRGIVLSQSPIIDAISLDPWSNSQAQLVWFRSIDDTSGASDQVTGYTVWGRYNQSVPFSMSDPERAQLLSDGSLSDGSLSDPWEYLSTVPAAGFEMYAVNVPHPYSPSSLGYWNECIVAAQTAGHRTYLSLPDTLVPLPSVTGIEEKKTVEPQGFSLFQNYPNPFNPTTVISGRWPVTSVVRLAVYDVLGREVAVLADGSFPAGNHQFTFDSKGLSSGVYFYRLTAGRYVATKAMLLEK